MIYWALFIISIHLPELNSLDSLIINNNSEHESEDQIFETFPAITNYNYRHEELVILSWSSI